MPEKHEPSPCSSHPLYVRLVSGSIGSIVTSLVVTPLEVVKVTLQAASTPDLPPSKMPPNVRPCPKGCGTFVLYNGQLDCLLPKSAVPFYDKETGNLTARARAAFSCGGGGRPSSPSTGTFTMLKRIYRAEGLNGIYAGLRPTLAMAIPNTVLYFSTYEDLVWRLRSISKDPTENWIPLVSGASARVIASSATAPFEYLRTRQASLVGSNQTSSGLWVEFNNIIKADGYGGLYRGFRPTLWRDVPFSAIYWVSLENMREMWRENYNQRVQPTPSVQAMQAFFNGAVSGMIAAACTTPFDVVKTRQQQQQNQANETTLKTLSSVVSRPAEAAATAENLVCCHGGAATFSVPSSSTSVSESTTTNLRSASTFESIAHIAKTEGLQGLWRGNQARMLKVAPSCAIMISCYEFGKRILETS